MTLSFCLLSSAGNWSLNHHKTFVPIWKPSNYIFITLSQCNTSRISAYLHHGHVSPFRIAADAARDGSAGALKFLDGMLIWRELAHHFCFHRVDLASLDAVLPWARRTLMDHQDDLRKVVYSWERLYRGQTGDALWDTAQKSLLIHGELHNNVRMTWGKAMLNWTRHPQEALDLMIDLNHRFALDGNDPNSSGGLLWCLGLFDRPFKPVGCGIKHWRLW